jgi:hypothetical protein
MRRRSCWGKAWSVFRQAWHYHEVAGRSGWRAPPTGQQNWLREDGGPWHAIRQHLLVAVQALAPPLRARRGRCDDNETACIAFCVRAGGWAVSEAGAGDAPWGLTAATCTLYFLMPSRGSAATLSVNWVIFSSRVMRASRSRTRSSMGAPGVRHTAAAAASTPAWHPRSIGQSMHRLRPPGRAAVTNDSTSAMHTQRAVCAVGDAAAGCQGGQIARPLTGSSRRSCMRR